MCKVFFVDHDYMLFFDFLKSTWKSFIPSDMCLNCESCTSHVLWASNMSKLQEQKISPNIIFLDENIYDNFKDVIIDYLSRLAIKPMIIRMGYGTNVDLNKNEIFRVFFENLKKGA